MEHVSLLHRSVSAVIWALPFCPSPFLPHISAAYFLVRHAGCTFSARSISLGWLIQLSKSFCERFLLCTPYTNRNPQGLFGIQFSKKILEIFDFFSRSSVFDAKSKVLFLYNSIFFIEIGCNAAFQRTATSKFDLDGILATPIYIRRTACTIL